jgi:hypothetical protein
MKRLKSAGNCTGQQKETRFFEAGSSVFFSD